MKQLLIIRADGSRLVLDYSQVQSIVRQNGKLNILLKDGSIISLEIGDQLALEAMQTESLETSPPKYSSIMTSAMPNWNKSKHYYQKSKQSITLPIFKLEWAC